LTLASDLRNVRFDDIIERSILVTAIGKLISGEIQVLILKIKQAETALDDGRLDEAFELLGDQELRNHRRGQRLLGRLARALARRGREHLEAQRLQQALADCNKAEELAGKVTEVAELRSAITEAIQNQHHTQQQQAKAIARAREHFDNGRLSIAENLLKDDTFDNNRAMPLLQEAAARRAAVGSVIVLAEKAIKQGDWNRAVDELLKAKQWHSTSKELTDLINQVSTMLTEKVQAALQSGRLDRAAIILEQLELLAGQTMIVQELRQIVKQCRAAFEYLKRRQSREVTDILRRLVVFVPGAKWISEALKNSAQAEENLQALLSSPLGLLGSIEQPRADDGEKESEPPIAIPSSNRRAVAISRAKNIPSKFLIQVDGVGSFPVFCEPVVTVGPISSAHKCDLALIAEPNVPVLSIERSDEDYFIRSQQTIKVNDKPLTEKLLADDDRISLSDRCRLRFRRPNAASTSAVLLLSAARTCRADVRQTILLDREIIIGPGPTSHIRIDQLGEKLILFVNDGRLFCRSKMPVMANEVHIERSTPLGLDTQIRVGELSFILTKL